MSDRTRREVQFPPKEIFIAIIRTIRNWVTHYTKVTDWVNVSTALKKYLPFPITTVQRRYILSICFIYVYAYQHPLVMVLVCNLLINLIDSGIYRQSMTPTNDLFRIKLSKCAYDHSSDAGKLFVTPFCNSLNLHLSSFIEPLVIVGRKL